MIIREWRGRALSEKSVQSISAKAWFLNFGLSQGFSAHI